MNTYLKLAKSFPILFSQVREDPRIDVAIIDSLSQKKAKVLMIASGGCTLAVLARHSHVESIDAVDVNSSQIDLCKLKLFLLNESPQARAEILGHRPLVDRHLKLSTLCTQLGIDPESFGCPDSVGLYGPDYVGRYEWLFRAFSEEFKKTELGNRLQQVTSLEEQRQLLNGDLTEIKTLFENLFSLDILIELFGAAATQNRKTSYANHFYTRFIWSLKHQFVLANPFFYQFAYLGYPRSSSTCFLSLPKGKPIEVCFHTLSMLDYLIHSDTASYDYIHLSNILDWLDPSSVQQLLNEVSRVLKPKGKLCIRQLNSAMDIKNHPELVFEVICDDQLVAKDLSFFYPQIYIGEKR